MTDPGNPVPPPAAQPVKALKSHSPCLTPALSLGRWGGEGQGSTVLPRPPRPLPLPSGRLTPVLRPLARIVGPGKDVPELLGQDVLPELELRVRLAGGGVVHPRALREPV